LDRIQSLEIHFWDLVHTYATEPVAPGFPHAKEIIEADIGNIRGLVKNAMQTSVSSGCGDCIRNLTISVVHGSFN
jgi:hypothetical protein